MNPLYILIYLSAFIWAAVPFRQYGKRYFYYFYFSIIVDYLTIFIRLIFHSRSNFFLISCSILALIFVQEYSFIKKHKLILSFILLLISIVYFILNLNEYLILFGFIHALIVFTLIKDFVKIFISAKTINLFMAIMILDESITIFKYLGVISGSSNNYFYFYASAAFEILIAFFFWIKEDNPRLQVKIKSS